MLRQCQRMQKVTKIEWLYGDMFMTLHNHDDKDTQHNMIVFE